MLDRIVTVLEKRRGHRAAVAAQPGLRRLEGRPAAGPHGRSSCCRNVGFVNAYGLTETSSTIAVLTPDDHREAQAADGPGRRQAAGLGRASRCPASSCRSATRTAPCCRPGETGELFVRGEQVSGRYTGIGSVLDDDGWFPTKDIAMLDEERLPVHRRPQRRHHHPRRREHRARRAGGRARRAPARARRRRGRCRGSAVGPGDRRGGGAGRRRRPRPRRTARTCPQEFARVAHPGPGSVSRRAAHQRHRQGASPGDHRQSFAPHRPSSKRTRTKS